MNSTKPFNINIDIKDINIEITDTQQINVILNTDKTRMILSYDKFIELLKYTTDDVTRIEIFNELTNIKNKLNDIINNKTDKNPFGFGNKTYIKDNEELTKLYNEYKTKRIKEIQDTQIFHRTIEQEDTIGPYDIYETTGEKESLLYGEANKMDSVKSELLSKNGISDGITIKTTDGEYFCIGNKEPEIISTTKTPDTNDNATKSSDKDTENASKTVNINKNMELINTIHMISSTIDKLQHVTFSKNEPNNEKIREIAKPIIKALDVYNIFLLKQIDTKDENTDKLEKKVEPVKSETPKTGNTSSESPESNTDKRINQLNKDVEFIKPILEKNEPHVPNKFFESLTPNQDKIAKFPTFNNIEYYLGDIVNAIDGTILTNCGGVIGTNGECSDADKEVYESLRSQNPPDGIVIPTEDGPTLYVGDTSKLLSKSKSKEFKDTIQEIIPKLQNLLTEVNKDNENTNKSLYTCLITVILNEINNIIHDINKNSMYKFMNLVKLYIAMLNDKPELCDLMKSLHKGAMKYLANKKPNVQKSTIESIPNVTKLEETNVEIPIEVQAKIINNITELIAKVDTETIDTDTINKIITTVSEKINIDRDRIKKLWDLIFLRKI